MLVFNTWFTYLAKETLKNTFAKSGDDYHDIWMSQITLPPEEKPVAFTHDRWLCLESSDSLWLTAS